MVIQPARCQEQFESLVVGNFRFLQTPCSTLATQNHLQLEDGDEIYGECIVGALDGTMGESMRSIAQNFGLRSGNFQNVQSPSSTATLILKDSGSREAKFQVSACFNQTHAIESS